MRGPNRTGPDLDQGAPRRRMAPNGRAWTSLDDKLAEVGKGSVAPRAGVRKNKITCCII